MKHLYCTIIFLFLSAGVFSQTPYTYGNEWINYNQQYYKIKLAKEGIYKIDYATLSSAGVPVTTIDPRNFQIFIKGQEQFIHIEGEADGVFDAADFIEFYGKANDCSFDSSMYVGTSFLPNPWYSVVQDTAVAFLTWNSSQNNKRFVIETDTAFASYTPSNWFYNYSVIKYRNAYSNGAYNNIGAFDPRYTPCEGWVGSSFTAGNSSTTSVPTPSAYSSGPAAKLNLVYLALSADYTLYGDSTGDHHLISEWKDGSGVYSVMRDSLSWGFRAFKDEVLVNPSLLGSTTDLRLTSVTEPDYNFGSTISSPTYASAWYPQTYDLQNKYMYTLYIPDETGQSKTRASFTNFQGGTGIKAFDLTNGKIVYPVINGNSGNFLLPNGGNIKKVLLTRNDSDIVVTQLNKVNGTGNFVNYMLQSGDSAFVIVTHNKLLSAANQYKSYKQTAQAGSYNVVLADVEDLYDQFAYGINKHPKSIRNFTKFLVDSFPSSPSYLFLLGKSITATTTFGNSAAYDANLVPSWGAPSSDNMITAGLNNTYLEPLVPIGRISATNPQAVLDYLEKVQMHDTMSLALWQKNVIHFVGGSIEQEVIYFNSIMNQYKGIIEDTLFGANVISFVKNTSAPIQTTIPDSIIDLVNAGASLLTFYGHGSNQSFDFDINDPNVFDNTGRYPVLLSNSCYSGNIHLNDTMSLSERYVLTPDKGTIAFVASVSLGVAHVLKIYSENFYKHCSSYSYGKGIGDICKGAILGTQYIFTSLDSIERITCMEMTLHGDPSVQVNPYIKPDYSISNADLFFNTNIYVDSIQVNLKITNLARAINDSIYTRVTRIFPNGTSTDFIKKIKAPKYIDTLSFFIPIDVVNGAGLNYFTAAVDLYDDVDEIENYTNNQTYGNIPLIINGDDIVPVYPYEFEVLPLATTIRLKASTINPLAPARNYIFQLDTTDTFTNPIAVSPAINATGGVVEWTASLLPAGLTDSIVYYWRVSRDSIDTTGYNWRESSFQTIDSLYGWEQAHFFQYKKDRLQFLDYNRPQRLFDFQNNLNAIYVHNGFYNFWGGSINDVDLLFNYNSHQEHAASTSADGWSFYVIDSITGLLDTNHYSPATGTYQYGTCSYGLQTDPVIFFDFGNYGNAQCHQFPQGTPEMGDSIAAFLNSIPYGKYVLGVSNNYWRGLPTGNTWNASAYTAFNNFGISGAGLAAMQDTIPIVFLGRRGMAPGTAHMETGIDRTSIVDFKDSIQAQWDRGYINSTVIGPSYKWHSLHWRYASLESNSQDEVRVYVLGITPGGQSDTLLSLDETKMDVLNLDTAINATVYPFIRMVAQLKDDSLRTAPQLKRWHVIYAPAPEGALHPAGGFSMISNDTLQEGDTLRLVMPFKNVSEFLFRDSLVFTYSIEDVNHNYTQLTDKLKADSLLPDSIIYDTVKVSTLNFSGQNGLWIDVNPLQNTKYQWEQQHFNNIVRIPFEVRADKINPILDVTFDGVHILNKDIISARPQILITLKDENKFLALNDTADFEVYLTWPGSGTEQRIWFCPGCPAGNPVNEVLKFEPAQLPKNSCRITYNPDLFKDGIYTLRVKGQDKSSNESGATDYKIQFEIVNKPSVTHVLNYPNPFSTSTRFVFTLTGAEVPETFMIQVMTIAGKVVREITREELGAIHIGRNITEYAWDGKDQFGDQLANGVYLYRVVSRLNGEKIDNRETAADQFFTKELGKMVLIR